MRDLQAQNKELLAREPEVREVEKIEYRTDNTALRAIQRENEQLKAEVTDLKQQIKQIKDYFVEVAKSINAKASFNDFKEKVINLFKRNKELEQENKELKKDNLELIENATQHLDFNDLIKESQQKQRENLNL